MNGKTLTDGTRNSVEEDVMSVTRSGHMPAFVRVRGSSENESRQTLRKLPESAMSVTSLGAGAFPETWNAFGLAGSLLKTVTTPAFAPNVDGRKRMGMSMDAPEATISG